MTKYEYLARLEQLLAGLSPQQRRDALDYYAEYFDAAGEDHEEETAQRLGDPETVARDILEGEADNAGAGAPPEEAGPGMPVRPNGKGWLFTLLGGAAVLVMVALALGVSALTRPGGAKPAVGSSQTGEASAPSSQGAVASPDGGAAMDSVDNGAAVAGDQAGQGDDPAVSPAAASSTGGSQVAADWENVYTVPLQKVELELVDVDLTVAFDAGATGVALRGGGIPADSLYVDQGELTRDAKLEARLNARGTQGAVLTLVLPTNAAPQRLELKLTGGTAVLPGLTLDELEIDSVGSLVTLDTVTARQIELEEQADGQITTAALSADEIVLEVARGSLRVEEARAARELDVEVQSGTADVTVGGAAGDFRLEAENKGGSLTVAGESVTGKLERAGATSVTLEAECEAGGQLAIAFTG